ncbi:MAG: MarR family transcriptional regulator, partial [Candidatus Aenigmarchaeota archaeon]|nr:MarR family transcriptional regulator [Candidatus Aenigmarchaeota archaeon]
MELKRINYIGLVTVAVSLISLLILVSVSVQYGEVTHSLCGAPYCSSISHIPPQSYFGSGILLAMTGVGIYLALNKNVTNQPIPKSQINKSIKTLQGEEKQVFDYIVKNEGSSFQGDLINKTGFSKVKVSRVLDKLETKGLIERRRHGMSNFIVLKS